jgi:hypothetical protein
LITTPWLCSLYLRHYAEYIIPEIEEEIILILLILFGPIYFLFNDGFGGPDYAV